MRYRSLVEASALDVWSTDESGSLSEDMPRWRALTGQTREAIRGDGWLVAVHPDDRDRVRGMWESAVRRTTPYEAQYRILVDGGGTRTVLDRGIPILEDGRVVEWVGTSVDVTEQVRAEEALRDQGRAMATLHDIGRLVSSQLDLGSLVQAVTDATTELTGAEFGSFFYNVEDGAGGSYMLHTLSGVPAEAFARFPMPRNTAIFAPTFAGEGVVRLDDVTQDVRYGQNDPHFGMPKGHLPVASYLAVPVVAKTGEVHGGLFFGHSRAGVFTEQHERIVVGVAAQAAAAIDNARLYQSEQSARRHAERIAGRLARLQSITSALSQGRDSEEVASAIAAGAEAGLGAGRVAVLLVTEDGERLRLVASRGTLEGPEPGCEIDLTERLPVCDAVRQRAPVFFATAAERDAHYGGVTGVVGRTASYAAMPLILDGAPIGVLGLGWAREQALADDDRRFLHALADQCAQAFDRARLDEAERRARADLEKARERLAFLAEASRVLASSLDIEETLGGVVRLLVPEYADTCSVHLYEGEQLRMMAHAHADSEVDGIVAPTDGSGGLRVALRGPDGELGVLALAYLGSRREYGAEDVRTIQELADRASVAISNARAHQAQAELARTLQQSLLPPRLLEVPGLQIAARYHPVGDGSQAGGDFYDVFRVGQGRWGVVIGDVSGKGVNAASLTSLARYTVRAAALREPTPSAVLRLLNQTILDQDTEDRFCTVATLHVSPFPDGARVTIALGGHPQPFLLRADGRIAPFGVPGTLMGLLPDADLVDDSVDLGPGDTLVLYTDGITEPRSPDGAFGFDLLEEVLPHCVGAAADDCAGQIAQAVLDWGGGTSRDDMAVLVIRVPAEEDAAGRRDGATAAAATAPADPASTFEGRYPATRAAVVAARHELRTWLQAHAAPDELREQALLATTEATTNAVRAARTGFRVSAAWDDGQLAIDIVDDGPGFEHGFRAPDAEPDLDAEHGRGLFIVQAVAEDYSVRTSDAGTVVRLRFAASA